MSSGPSRGKRVTLTDVAREAGVSVQTASHVLSGNMTVRLPEATRERVRQASVKVGYRPNRHAQAIRSGKTNVIAIWMPVDRPITTYIRMIGALSELAKNSGYELMISGLSRDAALKTDGGKPPHMWPVDGIISIDAGKAIEALRQDSYYDSTPVCVLGYEEVDNGDCVQWDIVGAVRQATQDLIAQGHTDIQHVTMDWIYEEFPNERRRRGYSEAMLAAGLEPKFVTVKSEDSAGVKSELIEYFGTHPVPTCLTSFSDTLAIGAARAILACGKKIPEDCRIWGFGSLNESEDFVVPISTMRMPIERIMPQAWEWLLDRIENPNQPLRSVEFPMELVNRESTNH